MEETKRRRYIIRAVLEGEVDVQEASPLRKFERVADAVFYNRYNNQQYPLYCNIHDNIVEWNTQDAQSNEWYWNGSFSNYHDYIDGNKTWLTITSGQVVEMRCKFTPQATASGIGICLKRAANEANIFEIAPDGNEWVSKTWTANADTDVFIGFNIRNSIGRSWTIEFELYIDGERVV